MIEYKLSDYLNAINFSKVNLLDGDDLTWERNIHLMLLIVVYLNIWTL